MALSLRLAAVAGALVGGASATSVIGLNLPTSIAGHSQSQKIYIAEKDGVIKVAGPVASNVTNTTASTLIDITDKGNAHFRGPLT